MPLADPLALLADPACRAMLAEPCLNEAAADWLTERGADTPACWAQLVAGTPPEHADGALPAVLAAWLEARGESAQAEAVREYKMGYFEDGGTAFWWVLHPGLGVLPHLTPARARRDLLRRVLALPWAAECVYEVMLAVPEEELALSVMPSFDRLRRAHFRPNNEGGNGYHTGLLCATPRGAPGRPRIGCYRSPRGFEFVQRLTAPQLVWPEPAADPRQTAEPEFIPQLG